MLVITGNLNRDILVKKLEEARAIVDQLQVYKTEPNDLAADPAAADFRTRGADAVLICADTPSTDPVELAGLIARDRATGRIPAGR